MVRLRVNGKGRSFAGPPFKRLIDVLREDFGLIGTKEGCGEGECGACSVLMDGLIVDACLVPVCQADGREVRTVEGLGRAELPSEGAGVTRRTGVPPRPADLDILQTAFLETGGAQCGICTPGMLMAGQAFLESGSAPTDDAIRESIAGNLCRCTGYVKIVEAIALAAERRAAAAVG